MDDGHLRLINLIEVLRQEAQESGASWLLDENSADAMLENMYDFVVC